MNHSVDPPRPLVGTEFEWQVACLPSDPTDRGRRPLPLPSMALTRELQASLAEAQGRPFAAGDEAPLASDWEEADYTIGGRFYHDAALEEMFGPLRIYDENPSIAETSIGPCLDPRNAARAAGQLVLHVGGVARSMRAALPEGWEIAVWAATTDHRGDRYCGFHVNLSVDPGWWARAYHRPYSDELEQIRRFGLPAMLSLAALFGKGYLAPTGRPRLWERVGGFGLGAPTFGEMTVGCWRALWNFRPEPHGDLAREHDILLDPVVLFERHLAFVLGASQLVRLALQRGAPGAPDWTLRHPVAAAHQLADGVYFDAGGELHLEGEAVLRDGARIGAIELFCRTGAYLTEHVAEAARELLPATDWILERWAALADALATDPLSLVDEHQGIAMLKWLDDQLADRGSDWDALAEDPQLVGELQAGALEFVRIDRPGFAVYRDGPDGPRPLEPHLPSLFAGCPDSSGWFRAALAEKFHAQAVEIDWSELVFRLDDGDLLCFVIGDPAALTRERTAALLESAPSPLELARALEHAGLAGWRATRVKHRSSMRSFR